MLEDERGQWILGRHEQASCELALTDLRDGVIEHMVIDRTFVDDNGTRWIIDYKTGSHRGGSVDEFLDQEQVRYRQQLERYANAMSKMEDRPIRLGLYFPLLGGWREWGFE
jgi:ATP-dependent exoDNAse (exonuclease V) beta subunit